MAAFFSQRRFFGALYFRGTNGRRDKRAALMTGRRISAAGHCARRRCAFTLIETLIVVTLLAIVASVVIPAIVADAEEAELTALKHNENLLNKVISAYDVQHNGETPEVRSGSLPQLFVTTNVAGLPGTGPAFSHGPYLAGNELPLNPRTDSRVVKQVAQMPPAAYTGNGWLYHRPSGQIMADDKPGNTVKILDAPARARAIAAGS